MTSGISEAPPTGLGQLLIESRFAVPNHQRDYSWTEDEVKQMFDDLESALTANDKTYFLGLMVFMKSAGGALIVLDGQQRLATGVIYASAVRSWLRGYSQHSQDADQIQSSFIGRAELGETELLPRLIMNSANNGAFNDYVVSSVPTSEIQAALGKLKRQDRNRHLLEAALYCRSRVDNLAHELGDADKTAKAFIENIKYLRDHVSIARLIVSDDGAAFTIFETLNDRGLNLSPLDLIKNYLFGRAEARSPVTIRDMEARWTQMMATLSDVRPDYFLKAFWTSRHGRTQKPQLFPSLKANYKTPEQVVELSIDMLGAAEQYAAIESADDPVWVPYPPDTRIRIRNLRLLGARQVHPVVLAALSRMASTELGRLMKLLEVLIVRYQLIGGLRTGRLEIACARLANRIFAGDISTASDAFNDVADIFPGDDDFQAAFAYKQERTNSKAQYILRHLENEERRLASKTGESLNLTVEHVLPKNPGNAWKAEIQQDETIAGECVYRLGNLCLLTAAENKDVANSSFQKKKTVYAKSEIILTQKISETLAWSREEIEKRQARMAKLARTIWRFQ